MTAATGLVVTRCDPYGAEDRGPGIKLLGGMYPESHVGRIMWRCERRADARYRMVCIGGQYGGRAAADGGELPAYDCPGGHRGQVMPLCSHHRRMIADRQAGLCPACAFPPAARAVLEQAERAQGAMYMHYRLGNLAAAAQLTSVLEQLQAQSTELYQRGLVHRCPLELVEVS